MAAALLLSGVWLAGCDAGERSIDEGSGNSDAPRRSSAEELVEERVRRILALSDSSTIEIEERRDDGTVVARRVRKPAEISRERATWLPPPGMTAPTPGTVVRDYALDAAPTVVLVDDAGTVLAATEDSVVAIAPDGSESVIAEGEVGILQWDSDGDRLLLSGPSIKRVLAWPTREVAADFASRGLHGRMQFAPEGNGYWLLEDHVDFDASQPMRILWSVREMDAAGELRVLAQYHPVSYVGTCPQNGLVWTVPVIKHQIVPESGSLQECDANLAFVRTLTAAGESLDFAPVADASNSICFLRAPRLVDGAMRRTARAWTRDLAAAAPEHPLTAEPTFAVAVSPSGRRLAFVVLRGARVELVAADAAAVRANDISGPIKARAAFEAEVAGLLDDLRTAYAKAAPEGAPPIVENLAEQAIWPPEALVDSMADALALSLESRFGIAADGTVSSLGAIDDLLAEADGLLPEEEATVLAFAGCSGRAIRNASDATWILSTSTPALGVDTDAVTTGDDLLMTFHNPFYAAREALAGRVALHEVACELLSEWRSPIALVENTRSETSDAWFALRFAEAGIEPGAETAIALREAAASVPDNNVVSLAAIRSATDRSDTALRMLAALNLAETNPESAEALVAAAEAVQPLGHADLRIALCRQAERLAPDDPEVLEESASAHFAAAMYDEAEERFVRLGRIDGGGSYSRLVAEALEDIRRVRGEDGPSSP